MNGLTTMFLRLGNLMNSATNINIVGGSAIPPEQTADIGPPEGHHHHPELTAEHPHDATDTHHGDAPLIEHDDHHHDDDDHHYYDDDHHG